MKNALKDYYVSERMRKRRVGIVGNFGVDLVCGKLPKLPDWGEERVVRDRAEKAAGSAGYTAYTLGYLGMDPMVFGPLGNDHEARIVLTELQGAGVSRENLTIFEDQPTALSVTFVRGDGQRCFVTHPGNQAFYGWNHVEPELSILKSLDLVLLSGYYLMPGLRGETSCKLFEILQSAGVQTALDVGGPSEGWTSKVRSELRDLLAVTDWFFPNEDEFAGMMGTTNIVAGGQKLLEFGTKNIVLKMGAKGACYTGPNERFTCGAFKVNSVQDTVGAGDAFNAGFIAGLLRDCTIQKSLAYANATAAIYINDKSYPSWEAVRGFVANNI